MNLEEFWIELLSREPERILTAWKTLDEDERTVVLNHLRRMETETDWTETQQLSARTALMTLQEDSN
jgi:hypothetical protein